MAGERAEADSDSHPAEAGAEHDGAMTRAREPLVHDPLGGDARAPGEVLAEDGPPGARCERPAGDGPVGEVLAAHHVGRVAAGRANKPNIHTQGSKALA